MSSKEELLTWVRLKSPKRKLQHSREIDLRRDIVGQNPDVYVEYVRRMHSTRRKRGENPDAYFDELIDAGAESL